MIYLVIAAFLVNARNLKMLALVLVISASIFTPVPRESYQAFYTFCIAAECTVAGTAWLLRTNASTATVALCALMVGMHALGAWLDGYPRMSGYRLVMPILEHSQIIGCIILSNPFISKLRNI